MAVHDTLITRSAEQAHFTPGLRMVPSLRTIVIGCVDPRVDPTLVLASAPGEVAAIRNVGGRVTPGVLHELAMLRAVTQAAGGDFSPGWELIVLHHTDCGITRLQDQPALLAGFFQIPEESLAASAVGDPERSVAVDVDAIRGDPRIPGVQVSGLVYDVTTGRIATIVEP